MKANINNGNVTNTYNPLDLRIRVFEIIGNFSTKLSDILNLGESEGKNEFQCFRIVQNKPMTAIRGVKEYLAKRFGITIGRISQMKNVTKEYNRKIASRDSIIYRLAKIGWTQEEIGGVIGLDQSVVSRNMQNFSTKLLHILNLGESEGKNVSELSEQHSPALSWCLTLVFTLTFTKLQNITKFSAKVSNNFLFRYCTSIKISMLLYGRSRLNCIESNVCIMCGLPILKFRDELSRKEFTISGMCQKCQDKIFGGRRK